MAWKWKSNRPNANTGIFATMEITNRPSRLQCSHQAGYLGFVMEEIVGMNCGNEWLGLKVFIRQDGLVLEIVKLNLIRKLSSYNECNFNALSSKTTAWIPHRMHSDIIPRDEHS